MDERVFVRVITRQAGFEVGEAELTTDAVNVVCKFCQRLDAEAPHSPAAESHRDLYGFGIPSYFEPPQPRPASGSAILERCVEQALPDRDVAYWAYAGLHPDLRAQRQLSRYRPVARAALARDLRKIGRPLLTQFAHWGRFSDTDRYIDSDGVRRAGPAA